MASERKVCPICQAPLGRARSNEQNRFYHKMIYLAWVHWPESHGLHSRDLQRFRKRLQMSCGFYNVVLNVDLNAKSLTERASLAGIVEVLCMSDHKNYREVIHRDDTLKVIEPSSFAFHAMDRAEANELVDAVQAKIENVLQVPVSQLIKEHENAA